MRRGCENVSHDTSSLLACLVSLAFHLTRHLKLTCLLGLSLSTSQGILTSMVAAAMIGSWCNFLTVLYTEKRRSLRRLYVQPLRAAPKPISEAGRESLEQDTKWEPEVEEGPINSATYSCCCMAARPIMKSSTLVDSDPSEFEPDYEKFSASSPDEEPSPDTNLDGESVSVPVPTFGANPGIPMKSDFSLPFPMNPGMPMNLAVPLMLFPKIPGMPMNPAVPLMPFPMNPGMPMNPAVPLLPFPMNPIILPFLTIPNLPPLLGAPFVPHAENHHP